MKEMQSILPPSLAWSPRRSQRRLWVDLDPLLSSPTRWASGARSQVGRRAPHGSQPRYVAPTSLSDVVPEGGVDLLHMLGDTTYSLVSCAFFSVAAAFFLASR